MKVVILAGGRGTRFSEETDVKPKPMIEIGGKPILWHIMKCYSHYGFNEFVICLGYKGYMIKEYFANYSLHTSDVTIDMKSGQIITHHSKTEPWRVTLVDTGHETMTGGRLKRVASYVQGEPFMMTYGDGVSDVDIKALIRYHQSHGKLVTLTSTQPPGRFGALKTNSKNEVSSFQEKQSGDGGWVNAGFFVMQPEVFDYIEGDQTSLELEPLESIAQKNQLVAYKHTGFWQPMDTLRDRINLENLWDNRKAPWKLWD